MARVGRPCGICNHEDSEEIDRLLFEGRPIRELAVKWSISADSLKNHNQKHMGEALVKLKKGKRGEDGETALARLELLLARLELMLNQAEHNGQASLGLQAAREMRSTIESIAKITGELNDKPQLTINLAASPEWIQLQGVLLAALSPFPDARLAVADAIDMFGDAPVVRGELMP